MDEICVVITAYNLEKHIARCLQQLESQTFRAFNVLIVDDCSRDRTMEEIRNCADRISFPLQVLRTPENLGAPGMVRNFVLDSGKIAGKYVIFLDGDDDIEPNILECLHSAAIRQQADIVVCAYNRFEDETGHILCEEMHGFPPILTLPPTNDILCFVNASLWNKLIRTDIIRLIRFPDIRLGDDAMFCLELYGVSKKIAFVDDVLIHYRVRGGSIISTVREVDAHHFAEKLFQMYQATDVPWMRSMLSEVALIHIGVSMPLRLVDNPNVSMRPFLRKLREDFSMQYQWFRNNRWLTFRALSQTHGIKGIGLWGAKICHRLGFFSAFLSSYEFICKLLHIDIKF